MNRRGFLASCIALGAAPAIVRADALMRIVPREPSLTLSTFEGFSIGKVAGVFRVTEAFDIYRDCLLLRLDTIRGTEQICYTVGVAEDGSGSGLKQAAEALTNHIERRYGSLEGFVAPPIHEGEMQRVLR